MLSDILSLFFSSFSFAVLGWPSVVVCLLKGASSYPPAVSPERHLRVTSILVSSHFTEYKHVCTVYKLDLMKRVICLKRPQARFQNWRVSSFARFKEAVSMSPESPHPAERIKGLFRLRSCEKRHSVCLLAGATWCSKNLTAQQLVMHDRFPALQWTPCSIGCANKISG